jgi:hypothetical protein
MSTSFNRRYKRNQERLQKKIKEQFFKRIDGKTPEEIAVIMEQIRVKYNLQKPEDQPQFLNPVDING